VGEGEAGKKGKSGSGFTLNGDRTGEVLGKKDAAAWAIESTRKRGRDGKFN